MVTPIADGTVPWPAELAREYAQAGWWRGQALGAEIAAVADARPDATALVDGATRDHLWIAAGPGRRAGQPAYRRARPGTRRPDRGPAAQLLAVRRAHPGLPARRDRPGHGAARAPPARAGLPVPAQRGPRPGRARPAARLRPRGAGGPAACCLGHPGAHPGRRARRGPAAPGPDRPLRLPGGSGRPPGPLGRRPARPVRRRGLPALRRHHRAAEADRPHPRRLLLQRARLRAAVPDGRTHRLPRHPARLAQLPAGLPRPARHVAVRRPGRHARLA